MPSPPEFGTVLGSQGFWGGAGKSSCFGSGSGSNSELDCLLPQAEPKDVCMYVCAYVRMYVCMLG